MTGTKKSSHQKKSITRRKYNESNNITRPPSYDTSIKAEPTANNVHAKIECVEMDNADMNAFRNVHVTNNSIAGSILSYVTKHLVFLIFPLFYFLGLLVH